MVELECPVFRPTLEDVRSLTFEEYVESIEPQWGPAGVCRIVAPEGWTPRRAGYDDLGGLLLPRCAKATPIRAARRVADRRRENPAHISLPVSAWGGSATRARPT